MISITLNGQPHTIEENLSLTALINSVGLNGKPILIEYNLEPLIKEHWKKTLLKQNDKLEIITLAAGG